jgi:hypothetical protein
VDQAGIEAGEMNMTTTNDEVRPLPIATPIRDQVLARLETVPASSVIISVDGRVVDRPNDRTTSAKLAVMVKNADGKWSFAGWLGHTVRPSEKDTEFGFEFRRSFGGG